jgi:hypothetical protein
VNEVDWASLGLSASTVSKLFNANIRTIAQLRALGPHGFIHLPNIGRGTLDEVTRLVGWDGDAPLPIMQPPPTIERIAIALERCAATLERIEALMAR